MIILKPNKKPNILYSFGLGMLILISVSPPFYLRTKYYFWAVVSAFLLPIFIANIFIFTIKEFRISKLENKLSLIYKTFVGFTKKKDYPLEKVEFTYKQKRISFAEEEKDIFTLYEDKKQIIQLINDDDEWTREKLRLLVLALHDAGVKKKLKQDGLKDIEI